MVFEVQSTVYYILAVTAIVSILIMIVYSQVKKFDPLDEPTGVVLLAMMFVDFVDGMVKTNTNNKVAEKLSPYIASTMLYILVANISGLLAFDPPTSNYSVTLTLAAVSCFLIEYWSIKSKGVKGWFKGLFEPMAPFVIINLISKLGTLLSLSLRLFGNIIAGSILMQVIYQMFAMVSGMIPLIGGFNIFGVLICPFLHMYFDLFSGLMQTYLFCTLTCAFIGNELPSE